MSISPYLHRERLLLKLQIIKKKAMHKTFTVLFAITTFPSTSCNGPGTASPTLDEVVKFF